MWRLNTENNEYFFSSILFRNRPNNLSPSNINSTCRLNVLKATEKDI